MPCYFAHLPKGIETFIITKPPNILIRSERCANQNKRPCKKAGPCCLGTNGSCLNKQKCFNNLKEGEVQMCRGTLESAATTGR